MKFSSSQNKRSWTVSSGLIGVQPLIWTITRFWSIPFLRAPRSRSRWFTPIIWSGSGSTMRPGSRSAPGSRSGPRSSSWPGSRSSSWSWSSSWSSIWSSIVKIYPLCLLVLGELYLQIPTVVLSLKFFFYQKRYHLSKNKNICKNNSDKSWDMNENQPSVDIVQGIFSIPFLVKSNKSKSTRLPSSSGVYQSINQPTHQSINFKKLFNELALINQPFNCQLTILSHKLKR